MCWDRFTWECLKQIQGHSSAVLSLTVAANRLVSGKGNGSISFHSLPDLQPERVLQEHSSCVMALTSSAGRLISGSADYSIRVYEMKP